MLIPEEPKKQRAALVNLKRLSRELDTTPQMKALDRFLEREVAKIEAAEINTSRIVGGSGRTKSVF